MIMPGKSNPPQHADAGLHRFVCVVGSVYFALFALALPARVNANSLRVRR